MAFEGPHPFPITSGGTAVTSVTTTPTGTAFAGWDSNKNLNANAFVPSATFQTLTGSSFTMVVGTQQYVHLGGSGGTVVLPDATTLAVGQTWWFDNDCSGNVTLETNGGATLQIIPTGAFLTAYLAANGTSTGSWYNYFSVSAPNNNGVFITSATGLPSWLTNGTTGQVLTATTGASAGWANPAVIPIPWTFVAGSSQA